MFNYCRHKIADLIKIRATTRHNGTNYFSVRKTVIICEDSQKHSESRRNNPLVFLLSIFSHSRRAVSGGITLYIGGITLYIGLHVTALKPQLSGNLERLTV
jgi:hypothetical protein